MLIVFWSPHYREETAQMLTLVGGMCCRKYPCTIVGVENYLHTHNLGYHMLGSRYDSVRRGARRGSAVYYKAGEIYARHVCSEMGRVFRKDSVIPADGNGLMFMPMDQSLHEDSYRFMMHEVLDQQIDYLESQYDDIYLNLEAGNNDTTIEMLDRADVVVVCLPVNTESFNDFYERYRSLINKCFFVFFGRGGDTESLLTRIYQCLPNHFSRFCYVEMTRLLQNYLSDGRGLDYLDLFYVRRTQVETGRDFLRNRWSDSAGLVADVAEAEGEYRSAFAGEPPIRFTWENGFAAERCRSGSYRVEADDDYVKWKNETDMRIGREAIAAAGYGMRENGVTERKTILGIQYIVDWLIRYEHREIGNDCALIAEHMMRRRYVPREVLEWRDKNHWNDEK